MANNVKFTLDLDNKQYERAAAQSIKSTEKLATTTQSAGQKMSTGLNTIKLGWLAIAGAVMAVVNGVSKFVAAAAQEARSVLILNNALSKVGLSAKTVGEEIDALSKKTAIDDDRIRMMYSYGVAIGVPTAKLKQFAETSLDYSASTGKGLEMAMRMVGNAAKKGADEFDRISASVKGAAEASANSDFGIQRMGVAWGEMSESLGLVILENVAPAIVTITEWLNKIATWLNETRAAANKSAIENIKKARAEGEKYISDIKKEKASLQEALKNPEGIGAGNRSSIVARIAEINAEIERSKTLFKQADDELKKLGGSEIGRLKINTDINDKIDGQNKGLKDQNKELKRSIGYQSQFNNLKGGGGKAGGVGGDTPQGVSGGGEPTGGGGFSGDNYDMSWFNDAEEKLTQHMKDQADLLEEENRAREELAASIKEENERLEESMRIKINEVKDARLKDIQDKKALLTSQQFAAFLARKKNEIATENININNLRGMLGNVPMVNNLQLSANERLRNVQFEEALLDESGAAIAALFGQANALDRGMSREDILAFLQNEYASGTNTSPYIEYLDEAIIAMQRLTESVDDNNNLLDAQLKTFRDEISLGKYDIENVRDIRSITEGLMSQGLTGTSLLSSLSDLGISGRELGRTGSYAQQVFNFNQVTADQASTAAAAAASADVGG